MQILCHYKIRRFSKNAFYDDGFVELVLAYRNRHPDFLYEGGGA